MTGMASSSNCSHDFKDSQEHWHGFLLSAVTLGTHRELVESLRDMSAAEVLVAVNHRDGRGYTAIVWAALLGHRDDVELLLQSGADKDACSFSGLSALQGAAEKGYVDVCVALLEAGASVDRFSEEGTRQTALHLACASGHHEVVRLLLEHGAAPAVRDREGRSAFDLASSDDVKLVLDEYSKLTLHLYRSIGVTDPERVIVEHLAEGHSPIRIGRRALSSSNASVASQGSQASAVSKRSHSTHLSKLSKASRTSKVSLSSNQSTRIVASRHNTSESTHLRRRDTDQWLKAISGYAADSTKTASAARVPPAPRLPTIPASPRWHCVEGFSSPMQSATERVVMPPSLDLPNDFLSIPSALLHGVWVLKRVGREAHYHSRLMWIELGPRGKHTDHITFLCWSKDGRRSKCKLMPLAEVTAIQGPVFEQGVAYAPDSVDAGGRPRSLTTSSAISSCSTSSVASRTRPGRRSAWAWLKGASPPVDGLVLHLRRKAGPNLYMKFDDAAPYSPYEWRAALNAAKEFGDSAAH